MRATFFEIVVKGTLGAALVAAMEGFTVERVEYGRTHLLGWMPDQARLLGTLHMLIDLPVELVSVNPIGVAYGASE